MLLPTAFSWATSSIHTGGQGPSQAGTLQGQQQLLPQGDRSRTGYPSSSQAFLSASLLNPLPIPSITHKDLLLSHMPGPLFLTLWLSASLPTYSPLVFPLFNTWCP